MSDIKTNQGTESLMQADNISDAGEHRAEEVNDKTTQRIDIKPVFFESFEDEGTGVPGNIDMLLDIPLQVAVELGRTSKSMEEILRLGIGSVIELDKLAGEPVDILVNGKVIAQGEVVVIDENFGVRITDIISPSGRISKKD